MSVGFNSYYYKIISIKSKTGFGRYSGNLFFYRRKRPIGQKGPIGQKVLIKTFMYVEVSTHIEVFSCFCSYFIL